MAQESNDEKKKGEGRRFLGLSMDNLLLILMILSVFVGIALGVGLKATQPNFSQRNRMYLGFPGDLFLRMLKLLILPLIVSSLLNSLTRLNAQTAGKLGYLTLGYFVLTTFLAVIEGIVLVEIIRPGSYSKSGSGSQAPASCPATPVDSILDLLRNVFPSNMVKATFQTTKTCVSHVNVTVNNTYPNGTTAMITQLQEQINIGPQSGMNILGLVTLAVCFGIVVSSLGEVGRPLADWFNALEAATMKLVTWVIWYGPIGIAFLIAEEIVAMEDPVDQLKALGMYMLTVIAGLLFHALIVLPILYFLVCRSNPIRHFLGASQALVTALGTDSSSATLPVTIRCMEEKCGYDRRVARFVCPLGATVNMNGSALYEAVASIYITQVLGKELGIGQIILVSLTATLAAVGAAGIPQAGLVTLLMVLTAVDLPPEYAALIIPVDWLLDRVRTTVNVWGDTVGCATVNHFVRNSLPPLEDSEEVPMDNLSLNQKTSAAAPSLQEAERGEPDTHPHDEERSKHHHHHPHHRRHRQGKSNKGFQVELDD